MLRGPGLPPMIEDVDVLDPARGEVMVRMVASGICGTDAHAVTGEQPITRFPIVLGHEGAGVIEQVGEGADGLAVGDHVVIALYSDCGECRQCLRGRIDECDSEWRRQGFIGVQADGHSRVRQDGAEIYPMFGAGTLAEYTTIRAAQAIRIDPDLSLEAMCLTACGVATGVGAVLNDAHVEPGDSVLVVGCGGVGLNVIQGAKVAGASMIIAMDVNEVKLDLARTFGATHVINTSRDAFDVSHLVPGGIDVAFEVVGSPALIAACLAQTRIGGRCVLVGLTPPGETVPIDGRLLTGGRQLIGSRSGGGIPSDNIALFSKLYREGLLRLDELIGQTLSFDEVDRGFTSFEQGTVARSIVTFS